MNRPAEPSEQERPVEAHTDPAAEVGIESAPKKRSDRPDEAEKPIRTAAKGKGAGAGSSPSGRSKKAPKKPITSGKRVIGLSLPSSCMVYRVAANFPELEANDSILLQTRSGEMVGRVTYVASGPPEKNIDPSRLFPGAITRIIRKLSAQDLQATEKKEAVEKKAKLVCRKAIRALKLPMKLAKVSYQHKGGKILFHFTSEGRIDFRELVRKLGSELKTRIEMRHVGVRDETRLLGGVGPCGKELCCSQYLQKFHPVSVRMAKNQDLSLNPDGISGVCGRLLCCLAYENSTYEALKKGLPKVKKCCWTQQGQEATVKCVHTLSQKVTVQHKDGSYETLSADQLSREKPLPQPIKQQDGLDGTPSKEVLVCPSELHSQKRTAAETKKTSPAGSPQEDTEESRSPKPERKKRSRRRRRGKRSGEEGGRVAASQKGVAQAAADNQVKPQATGKVPADGQTVQPGGSADSQEGGAPAKKRRRRRRRRRSGANRGTESPPQSS
ncbi:MAG: hypothetical protein HQL72_01810 [Magnetococcales bacterium]|nr:hypothetical protein [Magnetococcales bacterium]